MTKVKLTPFQKGVFKLVRKVPKGKVATYQTLACALGRPGAARAVGNALNKSRTFRKVRDKNPDLIKRPCHRVVKSDGLVGGYARGEKEKSKILRREGVKIKDGKVVDFKKVLFKF